MSSSADYNQLLLEIQAITPENVLTPNMPVDVFVQEAENLYHWSIDDQTALAGGGLDVNLINLLPVRAGACREAQSLWIKERNIRKEAEQAWKEQAPAAYDLRNQLIHAFRYAFRKHAGLLARVEEIAQGDSNSDMVQDLNDLSVLGKANLDLVTVVGISLEMLDNRRNKGKRLLRLLPETAGCAAKGN